MDITELRAAAARTGDQVAALAALDPAAAPTYSAYALGVRDFARWLTDGDISPSLQRLLCAVEPPAPTPGGRPPG